MFHSMASIICWALSNAGCGLLAPFKDLLFAHNFLLPKLDTGEVEHGHPTMAPLDDMAFGNRVLEALLSAAADSGHSFNHS